MARASGTPWSPILFIESLRLLPILKRTVVEAGICISSPVRGLRPVPALRSAATKAPKPARRTSSLRPSAPVMAEKTASTASPALTRVRPVVSATAAIRSFLFTCVFPFVHDKHAHPLLPERVGSRHEPYNNPTESINAYREPCQDNRLKEKDQDFAPGPPPRGKPLVEVQEAKPPGGFHGNNPDDNLSGYCRELAPRRQDQDFSAPGSRRCSEPVAGQAAFPAAPPTPRPRAGGPKPWRSLRPRRTPGST